MRYEIEPVAKPRMTQSDRWKKRPSVERYRAFKDQVRLHNIRIPSENAAIFFVLPMPKSWSNKKKKLMNGKPHQQIPDLDNLLKAIFDSVFESDSHIWHLANVSKVWGYEGYIEIK